MMNQFTKNRDLRRLKDVTKVIKTHKLTDAQHSHLISIHRKDRYFEEHIQGIISALVDESYERGRALWDEVAVVLGYKDYAEVDDARNLLNIDWLNREVEVREREDK